jgi:hypothetical protein
MRSCLHCPSACPQGSPHRLLRIAWGRRLRSAGSHGSGCSSTSLLLSPTLQSQSNIHLVGRGGGAMEMSEGH